MLTHNQLLILFPQSAMDQCKTRPKRCLFGTPDPVENRILLEEQFTMDKERMLRRYEFDIETGSQNSCPFPVATNEEVQNHCIPESEVRGRSGRYSPYSKQKRITGKRQCMCNSEYGQTGGGIKCLNSVFFPCQCHDHLKHVDDFSDFRYHLL